MPKIRTRNVSTLKGKKSSAGATPMGRCPACRRGELISRRVPSGPPMAVCATCGRKFHATDLSA